MHVYQQDISDGDDSNVCCSWCSTNDQSVNGILFAVRTSVSAAGLPSTCAEVWALCADMSKLHPSDHNSTTLCTESNELKENKLQNAAEHSLPYSSTTQLIIWTKCLKQMKSNKKHTLRLCSPCCSANSIIQGKAFKSQYFVTLTVQWPSNV